MVPRYFFTLRDGDLFPDEEGQELPDDDAARAAAVESARELMAESLRRGSLDLRETIVITDAFGREVMIVPFRDTISIDD